jgi:plasmid maintenance system antidote protein VapI
MEHITIKRLEVMGLLGRQGRTVSSLAAAIGLSKSHAWRIVRGQRSCSQEQGRRIARYLGVPLDKISVR